MTEKELEYHRQWRAKHPLTQEQRDRHNRARNFKRAQLSDDDKEKLRAAGRRRNAMMTDEQKLRRNARQREKYAADPAAYMAKQNARITPEQRAAKLQYTRDYQRANLARVRENWRKRHETHPQSILAANLRARLRLALKSQARRGSAVRLLGCTTEELMVHLESQFRDGMSWENYGLHGWHIDHIVPLAILDLTDPCELARGCHYTNLQPLWATENMAKGCRKA